ncbi:hypothetical protein AB0D67_18335 [Streptosporangium sp. NPDC048047]|uniref:hypothetical protein n=1 Tax=Streptosporangium sp. NPDC048047 TaxID=3155748 RepID=UPI0034155D68
MNAREPDWAYVARSLAKVVAVASVLFLALSVAERVLAMFVDFDDERMARVYGTAAHVVNPDIRLTDGHSDGGGLLETTYTLWGEPRQAGRGEGWAGYGITKNLFGTVRTSSLGDSSSGDLDGAITAVDADLDVDRELAEKARKTLDGLPQTLDAVAVVEFAHVMTTEQLVAFNRRHGLCGGADVAYIYSPSFYDDSSSVPSLNAVVWNRAMTEDRIRTDLTYQCETEPEAALKEFRRWVGLLDEGDDLSAFELDYQSLSGTAKEGVVYGLVVDRWSLAALRKLIDDPEVGTIHLADVAFDLGEIR